MKMTKGKLTTAVCIVMVGMVSQAEALSFQSVKTMWTEMQRQMSAWQISVKQTALSMHQRSDNLRKTRQISSVGKDAIQTTDVVKQVVIDYSSTLGQPDSIKCTAVAEKDAMIKAAVSTQETANEMMNNYSNTSTETVSSGLDDRLKAHKEMFCNEDEARAGACKLRMNGMGGWDSNYANFTANGTFSNEQIVGALAYAENMTEPAPPEVINCKSSACNEARAQYLSSAAHSSIVTKVFTSQISNRMDKETRTAFTATE